MVMLLPFPTSPRQHLVVWCVGTSLLEHHRNRVAFIGALVGVRQEYHRYCAWLRPSMRFESSKAFVTQQRHPVLLLFIFSFCVLDLHSQERKDARWNPTGQCQAQACEQYA